MNKLESILKSLQSYKETDVYHNIEARLEKILQQYVKTLNDTAEAVLSKKHTVIVKELSKK